MVFIGLILMADNSRPRASIKPWPGALATQFHACYALRASLEEHLYAWQARTHRGYAPLHSGLRPSTTQPASWLHVNITGGCGGKGAKPPAPPTGTQHLLYGLRPPEGAVSP